MNKFYLCQKLAVGFVTLSSITFIDIAVDPAQASTIARVNRALNSIDDLNSFDNKMLSVTFNSNGTSLMSIPKDQLVAPFTAVSSPDLTETLKPDEGIFELVTGLSSVNSITSEFDSKQNKDLGLEFGNSIVIKFKADPRDPEGEQPIFVGEFDPTASPPPPPLSEDRDFEIDIEETKNVVVDIKGVISNLFGSFTDDNFANNGRMMLGRATDAPEGDEYQVAVVLERKTPEPGIMFGLLALGGLGLGMKSKKQDKKQS